MYSTIQSTQYQVSWCEKDFQCQACKSAWFCQVARYKVLENIINTAPKAQKVKIKFWKLNLNSQRNEERGVPWLKTKKKTRNNGHMQWHFNLDVQLEFSKAESMANVLGHSFCIGGAVVLLLANVGPKAAIN
ncbi:hypothetical protein C8J56DRAFT_888634 [Mycena floridula]|nr:hypothetical protein C8J56DRAFT_888634 [Mycena floridula]